MTITQARLKEKLDYQPEVGVFTHRTTCRRAVAGRAAGVITHNGYIRIAVDGRRYRAHHLAWLWVYGRLPKEGMQIDHMDGDTMNNRICNLREVTPSQNQQNKRRALRSSTTGLLGVSRQRNKFRATIQVDGKLRILGRFDKAEDAHAAYLAAKRQFHSHSTL